MREKGREIGVRERGRKRMGGNMGYKAYGERLFLFQNFVYCLRWVRIFLVVYFQIRSVEGTVPRDLIGPWSPYVFGLTC